MVDTAAGLELSCRAGPGELCGPVTMGSGPLDCILDAMGIAADDATRVGIGFEEGATWQRFSETTMRGLR